MARYARFLTGYWRDPEIRPLSADARLLYAWSFSNEGCRVSGLYAMDLEVAFFETGLNGSRGLKAWQELLSHRKTDGAPLVEWDEKASVLWVRGRFKIESRTRPGKRPSSKIVLCAIRECFELPKTPLIERFRVKYAATLKGFRWGTDRVSARAEPRRNSSTSSTAKTRPIPKGGEGIAALEGEPGDSRGDGGPPGRSSGKRRHHQLDTSDRAIAEAQHRKAELAEAIRELPSAVAEPLLQSLRGCRVLGVYADSRRPVFRAPAATRAKLKHGLAHELGPQFAAKVIIESEGRV